MLTGLLLASLFAGHPIHSSAATVFLEPGGRVATITLRVFADDFPPGGDSAAVTRYLATRFLLTDRTGRPLTLELHSIHVEGAALVLALSAPAAPPEGLAGARVWHGVLMERYADQVNLVRVQVGSRTVSLLFTPGDGPKLLP